jgi:hypothetical protein
MRALKNAQMRSLFGFSDQLAQVGLSAVAQVVLIDGPVTQIEEPETETEFAAGGALNHAMAFENHEKTMRGTFMQLQRRGNLCQTLRRVALAKQIEDGEGSVKGLNFIGTLRC